MEKTLDTIYKVIRRLDTVLLYLGAIGVYLIMFTTIIVVTGRRTAMGEMIPGYVEIVSNYLMPLIVFVALGLVYRSGIMPRLDVTVFKAPGTRRWLNFINLMIELAAWGLVTYYGGLYAVRQTADLVRIHAGIYLIPSYPIYWFVPVGCAMLCLEIGIKIWRNFQVPLEIKTIRDF